MCNAQGCYVDSKIPRMDVGGTTATFEFTVEVKDSLPARIVELAEVLFESNPERMAPWEHRYTWSDALMDAVDIVVVSEALSEENE